MLKQLRLGEKVFIQGDEYRVEQSTYLEHKSAPWYMDGGRLSNDHMFRKLSKDSHQTVRKIMGNPDYNLNDGVFPFCKSLEDLSKVVAVLQQWDDENMGPNI